MVSRNTIPSQNQGSNTTSTGSGQSNSTTNSSQSTSSNTRGSSSSTTKTNQQNMTSTALNALDSLIRGLSTGGSSGSNFNIFSGKQGKQGQTAEDLNKNWLEEIAANRQIRADYSKSAAFADAQGAQNAAISKALNETMPTITAGIDAAGTSGSAMAALLSQQNAQAAADQAATLGLQAAISYGQIANQASGTLSGLIESGDPATQALLQALGIAKGAVTKGTTTENSSSQQSTNSTTVGTQNTVTDQSQQGTQTITPTVSSGVVGSGAAPASTKTYSGSDQAFYTPSSYRNATYNSSVGSNGEVSYSQFK